MTKAAKAKEEVKEEEVKIEPLAPRIHLNEYVSLHTSLDVMQKAGFSTFCKKEWMRKDEWDECLEKYLK